MNLKSSILRISCEKSEELGISEQAVVMAPYQPYKPVPQELVSGVPIPMQSYNGPLKSGYSTDRSDYLGYDSAQAPLTGTHHKLLLKEDDLVGYTE